MNETQVNSYFTFSESEEHFSYLIVSDGIRWEGEFSQTTEQSFEPIREAVDSIYELNLEKIVIVLHMEEPDNYLIDINEIERESHFFYEFYCNKKYKVAENISNRFPAWCAIGGRYWFTASEHEDGLQPNWYETAGFEIHKRYEAWNPRYYIATVLYNYADNGALKKPEFYLQPLVSLPANLTDYFTNPRSMIISGSTRKMDFNCESVSFERFGVRTFKQSGIRLTINAIYFEGTKR